MGVSGSNFGHSRTDFVGWNKGGGGGVSGTRYFENAHALPMDGRLAGTLACRAGGDELYIKSRN